MVSFSQVLVHTAAVKRQQSCPDEMGAIFDIFYCLEVAEHEAGGDLGSANCTWVSFTSHWLSWPLAKTHNFGFCPQVANGLQLTKDCPFTHFSKSLVSEYIGCLGISLDIVIGVLYHLMAVERGGSVDGNYIVIVRNKTITNIHSLLWVMVSRMPCRYVMICTLICVLLCIDL